VTYFKIALILLQIVQGIMRWAEKQGIIKDEQRNELARQLQLAAAAAGIKEKHKAEVAKLDEKQVDDALSGDFRP
jgi:hypothetical protein